MAFWFMRIPDHTQRRTTSVRVISTTQRHLPDNTHHSKQTDLHAPGGIRTHNLSRRAATDSRLRPRGNWDRMHTHLHIRYIYIYYFLPYTYTGTRINYILTEGKCGRFVLEKLKLFRCRNRTISKPENSLHMFIKSIMYTGRENSSFIKIWQ